MSPFPYEVRFVALGEGYTGEWEPSDPDDRELLRLDIADLDDPDNDQSLCTEVPADLRPAGQRIILMHVRALLLANPGRARAVCEAASWADDRVCDVGFTAERLALHSLVAPTAAHLAEAAKLALDDETA